MQGLDQLSVLRSFNAPEMKRRLEDAGLHLFLPHSSRVTVVTDLLNQNVLEDVQHLGGHASATTTRIYDQRRRKVTRNIVERISI